MNNTLNNTLMKTNFLLCIIFMMCVPAYESVFASCAICITAACGSAVAVCLTSGPAFVACAVKVCHTATLSVCSYLCAAGL